MFWYVIGISVLIALYWKLIYPLGYWKRKGVPYVRGYPIVGNFLKLTFKQRSFGDSIEDVYKAYPNEPVVGMFLFTSPTLLIVDPEIIKRITVKDFEHFTDHTETFFKKKFDPLFDKNLFSLTGTEWHNMRTTLSPAFTGSKMRNMFSMIIEVGEQFSEYYVKAVQQTKNGILDVELKELFTRFTNDVIASAAFGIKVDSFEDRKNDFYIMGRKTANFSQLRILLINLLPDLMRFLGVGILPGNCCDYFRGLVRETLAIREKNNIIRPDMIHLLMQARKGELKDEDKAKFANGDDSNSFFNSSNSNGLKSQDKTEILTNDDIAAQAFIFFLAGFDTVSVLMCFATYELALNPDIQQKLYEEIEETYHKCNGKLTYDVLQKMKYLDQVTSESLRKWPPAILTDRQCTKDYTINTEKGPIHIGKGSLITIPQYGLHRDPKYFPKPDVFDPERFSDENKNSIKPFTYMPFGIGPRICIASRFALMEAKTAIFYTIKNFEVVVTSKTTIPPRLTTKSSNMIIENGFQIGLKLRSSH